MISMTFYIQPFKKARHSGLFALALAVLLTALQIPSPALAQGGREFENRLQRLENEIQTMGRVVYRGEAPPPTDAYSTSAASQTNTELRLQQLEGEIRNLTGRLEQQDYDIRQTKSALDKALADMSLRLQDLEQGRTVGGNVAAITPSSPPSVPSAPPGSASTGTLGTLSETITREVATSAAPGDDAARLYENSFAVLRQGDFQKAQVSFQGFLDRYPTHSLAANAKYWLGETYYAGGDYERAARIFAEAYQQYPSGTKAPDNLLKLALSLSAMDKPRDACVALDQLIKDFATGAGPVVRRAEQEKTRLGC